jgi:hypothetical protein
MELYEKGWPESFHSTLAKRVFTMAINRKHVNMGKAKVFDTETIYARAIGLQSSGRSLDMDTLLAHELAPFPTSMFDSNGQMRDAKAKSMLKNALKVVSTNRTSETEFEAVFLDGCAVLWVIPWPARGTVQDFIDKLRGYLYRHLSRSDVYLVFDWYNCKRFQFWVTDFKLINLCGKCPH